MIIWLNTGESKGGESRETAQGEGELCGKGRKFKSFGKKTQRFQVLKKRTVNIHLLSLSNTAGLQIPQASWGQISPQNP